MGCGSPVYVESDVDVVLVVDCFGCVGGASAGGPGAFAAVASGEFGCGVYG